LKDKSDAKEVEEMVENQIFISVKEICKTLSVSESKAYSIEKRAPKALSLK
jgi:predicted DNA-binding transcriptional regulator AlpA